MATAGLGFFSSPRPPRQLCYNSRFSPLFRKASPLSPKATRFSAAINLTSATAFPDHKPDRFIDDKTVIIQTNILACPICYNHFIWNHKPQPSMYSLSQSTLECSTCQKTYYGNDTHIDLTISSGGKAYGETMAASTEIFRIPFISFLYERGWRQSFSLWGGFPGPEKEFELMQDYLEPVMGGNIIDASCGSGLFSRLFAKSGRFSLVVALDFSEAMLQQCYEFINQEENFPKENIVLVRADISRLPFASSTVDAVHAGAALHCWPSPSSAVAEISRVLRPGGVFVATTYIMDGIYSLNPFLKPFRQRFAQVSGSHIFLNEKELEDLCTVCGLVGFKCIRNGRFIMLYAMKPT
ncbi:unnamed protein product [Cuscuta campestris]|uniref:Methyltransferase type 11 domain-containing protein n=1 Tax=Cuscuta campestris TaxID=132261 RepID=A0A484MCY0_9ASTE|nr:unnamed protein product [Cuscuta campestris]